MTAIRPSESALRDKIDADSYNSTLNVINPLLPGLIILANSLNLRP